MKEYSNGEITVFWDPKKCIHSANCVRGLPRVFNHDSRPWINMKGASSEEIMEVIDKCPSGALSYNKSNQDHEPCAQIRVTNNGPLLVDGDCLLIDGTGGIVAEKGPFALCRCGGSKNKPYCDGTHKIIGFDDTKAADRS
jgi:uncharacterized Fe-S cluster protein YjdI/CDGSH-type Zn-finger protein